MTATAAAPSQERRDQLITEAKAIAEKAKTDGRDLTTQEREEIAEKLTEVKGIQEALVEAAKSANIMAQLDGMAASVPDLGALGGKGGYQEVGAKTLGEHFVKHAHASLIDHKGQSGFTVDAPEFTASKANTDPQDVGSWSVGSPFLTDFDRTVVQAFRIRLTVDDLLSQGVIQGNAISYLIEGAMEGDYATVAEGGAKPQIHFVNPSQATDALKKIAGFIKLTDEFLEDADFLKSEIDNRLLYRLGYTQEQQLLNGSGTGQNILGLLNRSGIQTEVSASFATTPKDWEQAIFRAATKVETNSGLPVDGVVIHPTDYQTFRLRQDANGQYYGGGFFQGQYGVNGIAEKPPLWGYRTVVTPAIAQGTALVGSYQMAATAYSKVGRGVRVEAATQHASDFTSNLVTIRAEVRRALAVRVPLGFCKVTLTP